MKKVSFPNSNNGTIKMAAHLYFPPNFDEGASYPAIIVSHPGGGVKEQTAGTYAERLAEQGFVTIAYDASYQGESGGEPRQLENPHIRTEDISAVINYMTALPYVNNARIGAMGICAGGGYTINAAINDRRIRAVSTVSAVNFGASIRNGWDNDQESSAAIPLLEQGSEARIHDAAGKDIATMPLAPMKEADAPNEDLRQAWEYYHTPRAQQPTAPGYATLRSLTQVAAYDAYQFADVFLTQPLLIVVGSEATSKWMSDDLLDRAASSDKMMHVVNGANHMDMYDKEPCIAEAIGKLSPFFAKSLEAAE